MTFKITLAALVVLATAGVASAKEAATIKLAAPVAGTEKVIADGAVWVCAADACTTTLRNQPSVRGCKDVSKALGAVLAYGHDDRQLDEDDLAKCNATAKAAAATETAAR